MTYSQGVCSSDSQCDTTAGLICNLGSLCNCPEILSTGYCDCPNRVSGNEQYWNGAACVTANNFTGSCSGGSYMCQILTLNLICNATGNTCVCATPGIFYSNFFIIYIKILCMYL